MSHHRSLKELHPTVEEVADDGEPALNPDDRRELLFDSYQHFKAHLREDSKQIYTSINILRDNLFQVYDESTALKEKEKKFTDANDQLRLDNAELVGENARLVAEVAELKRLTYTHTHTSDHSTLTGVEYPRLPRVEKSSKLDHPPMFNGSNMDVDDWIGKMRRKLEGNADHFPIESMKITYVDNRTEDPASKHLAPRLKDKQSLVLDSPSRLIKIDHEAIGFAAPVHAATTMTMCFSWRTPPPPKI